MRSLRFIFIGIITFLFVTNVVFLRRTVSVLLCGVLSFNSASCYSFLDNYGKADAAAPLSKTFAPPNPSSNHADVVPKQEQKVAVCVFGVCVEIPKIPIVTPKVPDENQLTPKVSPQQPSNGEPEKPVVSDNEKPTTDLTGIWNTTRPRALCTINRYTLANPSMPSLTVNGEKGKESGEVNITQSGNQISIPARKFVWDGGKYTYRYDRGNISANKFTLYETAVDTSVGWGITDIFTGTVSADGNTIGLYLEKKSG